MGSMLLMGQMGLITFKPQLKMGILSSVPGSKCALPAANVCMAAPWPSCLVGRSKHSAMGRGVLDSPRLVRSRGFAGNWVSREGRDEGRRMYKRSMAVMIRASQYDGYSPVNVSTQEEEGFSESVAPISPHEGPPEDSSTAEKSVKDRKSARDVGFIEEQIERTIFDFRFLTLFGVVGSLMGAILCFLKGTLFVSHSYRDYIRACLGTGVHSSRVILYLVEAVDVYLMGTVMLIFGMGLYELFVSSLEVTRGKDGVNRSTVCNSSLFGLFRLRQRPKWLEIRSLDELKTKLGHVIVMILLVGLFEKSKKVVVHSSIDFLCFSASILLSSGALYLLSMLGGHESNGMKKA